MTREEFEKKYAMKYRHHDFFHNPSKTLFEMEQNRKGEGYEDHHLDLSWKVQQIKNLDGRSSPYRAMAICVRKLEW